MTKTTELDDLKAELSTCEMAVTEASKLKEQVFKMEMEMRERSSALYSKIRAVERRAENIRNKIVSLVRKQ